MDIYILQFINSEKGRPKLIHDGYRYIYHQLRKSGHVARRCALNNKSSRDKGISCSSTAVTTGTTPSSSLEYAKPHSHIPDTSKISVLKIIGTAKSAAVDHPPVNIVATNLRDVTADVECYLLERTSTKITIQRRRRKGALSTNRDLTQEMIGRCSHSAFQLLFFRVGSSFTREQDLTEC